MNAVLLETGDYLLLETGDYLLLEQFTEASLVFAVGLNQTQVGNLIFTISVAHTLHPNQDPGEQLLLKNLESVLQPSQTIVANFLKQAVITTLVFTQDIETNIKSVSYTTTLEPIQEIDTSASTIADDSRVSQNVNLGMTVGVTGDGLSKSVTTYLTSQTTTFKLLLETGEKLLLNTTDYLIIDSEPTTCYVTGYTYPTLGDYRVEHIYVGDYS